MKNEESFIYPSGFEDAIVGADLANYRFIMCKDKMIEILIEREGMTYEDAVEFCAYNIWGAYVAECQPVYVDLGTFEELKEILDL